MQQSYLQWWIRFTNLQPSFFAGHDNEGCSTCDDAITAMQIPRELEGFDVAGAVARMLDRPELWWHALGFFVRHFSGWKNGWLESVGDPVAERRSVHAVRSAAANVGAVELARQAEALEKILLQHMAGDCGESPDAVRVALAKAFDHAWGNADAAWRETGCGLPE